MYDQCDSAAKYFYLKRKKKGNNARLNLNNFEYLNTKKEEQA